MDPIEIDEASRAKLTIMSLITFFVMFCGLVVLWNAFEANVEDTTINSISARCRENAGVVIEGVNETDNGAVNHFALCIPYEALTCIDIE